MLTIGSDVIYLNLAGTPVVVVNSAEAAHELFEKKSSLYSDLYAMLSIDVTFAYKYMM